MKSQTLSQFQSVMQELDEFGRGKDKKQRIRKKGGQRLTDALGNAGVKKINGKTLNTSDRKRNIATGAGIAGLTGAAVTAGVAQKKLGDAAVKQGKIAITSKNVGDMGRAAYESGGKAKKGLRSALQNTIKEADSTMVKAATKARNLNIGKNIAKAGKVGAGLAAGGLLAGAAIKALKNKNNKK